MTDLLSPLTSGASGSGVTKLPGLDPFASLVFAMSAARSVSEPQIVSTRTRVSQETRNRLSKRLELLYQQIVVPRLHFHMQSKTLS